MGEVGSILITGANGFVGAGAVRGARASGIHVIALFRRAPLAEWAGDPGITPVQLDLSDAGQMEAFEALLPDVDALIHAAAHLGDDPVAARADTRHATQLLLETVKRVPVRLVLVSSIVVYDVMRLAPGDPLDETAALCPAASARDLYTASKIEQEDMVHSAGRPAWLIRPGAVWGPGRTWNALMGFWASKLFVQIGTGGELPLVHVDHLGRMLVQAAQSDPGGIQALNALDDDRPTRARFVRAHRRVFGWPRMVLPVPYGLWLGLARLLKPVSGSLPGLFREPILRARLMPLRYPNTRLRAMLGGQDSASFEQMLSRSREAGT